MTTRRRLSWRDAIDDDAARVCGGGGARTPLGRVDRNVARVGGVVAKTRGAAARRDGELTTTTTTVTTVTAETQAMTFLAGSTPGVMSAKHRARTSASDEDFVEETARGGDGEAGGAAVARGDDGTFSVDYDDELALETLMCELECDYEGSGDDDDDEGDADSTGDVTTILTSARSGTLRVRVNNAFEAFASLAYLAVSPSELDVSKRVAPTPMNTPANVAMPAQRSPDVATTLTFESPEIGVSRAHASPLVARLVRSINNDIEEQEQKRVMLSSAALSDDFDCFVVPGTNVVVYARAVERRALMTLCALTVVVNVGMRAFTAWSQHRAAAAVLTVRIEGSYFIPSMTPVTHAVTTFVAATFTDAYKAYGPVIAAHENQLAKLASLASAATRRHRFEFVLSTLSYAGAFTAYFSMLCFVLAALSKIMTSVVDALHASSSSTSSSSAASNDPASFQDLRGMLTPPLFFRLVNTNDHDDEDKAKASSSSATTTAFTPLAAAPASYTPEIV